MSKEKKNKTPLELFPKLAKITKQWTQCADCNDPHPKWAEIDRGILICLQCSGVHRSLGTHVSKVRSITLDKWTQEMVDNMKESNIAFNKVYEYHVDKKYMKPTSKTRRDIRSKYIKAKYVGIEDYKITKKLIPAFHKDQFGALPPIFASDKYDEVQDVGVDEKESNSKKSNRKNSENVGMVEYSGIIKLNVIKATDLPKADTFSDSDPYVIFRNSNGQEVKTKVIDNDNNPKWNEHLILSVNEKDPVQIEIYDEDNHSKDDLLCTGSLDVGKQCKNGEEVKFTMAMDVDKHFRKQKKNSKLHFSVIYEKMDAK